MLRAITRFRSRPGLLKGSRTCSIVLSQFNLLNGESATFAGLTGVNNVLARVTGGQSSIDGRINCAANLFLINPQGIIFGPNATIDVAGSFVASTANTLKLSDGVKFNALVTAGEVDTLTAAPVSAFGFFESNSGGGDFYGDEPGGQIRAGTRRGFGECDAGWRNDECAFGCVVACECGVEWVRCRTVWLGLWRLPRRWCQRWARFDSKRRGRKSERS